MAKVVCKNCGHKNPSSASVCENCGNFMFDEPQPVAPTITQNAPSNIQEQAVQDAAVTSPTTQDTGFASQQQPVAIKVSGSGALQQLSTLSGFIILGLFFLFEFMGYLLNFYYFLVFLVLIFVVPTLLRRAGSIVRFMGPDFAFRNSGSAESYPLMDVENIKINQYNRMDQMLTINFRENRPPLQVEFNSIMAFRSVVVAFSRRRIPIIPANAPTNANNAGA